MNPRPPRQPQPTDELFNVFAITAAHACTFELQLRILADNTPALNKSFLKPLDELTKLVVEWMETEGHGTPEERAHVRACAVLRNKLLHSELSRATGKLVSLGVALNRGTVHKLDLETGESAKVSDLNIVDGRVFGWLLEGAGSGAFEEARAWFSEGMRIIESVLIAESTPDAAGDKGP